MATMISQKVLEAQEANDSVRNFVRRFEVGKLLHICRARKAKGFSVVELFVYLLCGMFSPISTYMAMRIGCYKKAFGKSEKKTELVSKFFNHVNMKCEKGFRILTLLWSDEYSSIPVGFCPLSSGKDELLTCPAKACDDLIVWIQLVRNAETRDSLASQLWELEQEQDRLLHYLSLLEERDEKILRMTYIDGLNNEQIAEGLSITSRRVTTLRSRAIDRLSGLYEYATVFH